MSRGPGLCGLVGVCGPLGWEWEGRGRRCGAAFACGVSVYVSACSGVSCVVSCTPGVFAEGIAVYRGSGEDFADAGSHLVYLLVGGGKRVLQGWAKAHAPDDPVDGVVPAGGEVLWTGGGGVPSVCRGLPRLVSWR